MRADTRTQRRTARAVLIILAALAPASSGAEWRAVEPAELQLSTSSVEPGADAEVLYWEVRITDQFQGGDVFTTFSHYLRIKTFTEKGAKQQTTVEIPFGPRTTISDLSARTIKPGGQIQEVTRDAVHERELVKLGRRKVRAKTFAFPGVVPGSILEYQYRETRMGFLANYLHLEFQRDLPIQRVKYFLKPLQIPWLPFMMRALSLQCPHTPIQPEPQGFYSLSLDRVPAFHEEPDMPPGDSVRPWVLIFYEEDKGPDARKYWRAFAKQEHNEFEDATKPNGDLKRAAQEAVSGAATEEEKLAALYHFARKRVRNVWSDDAGVSPTEREAFKPNRHAGDAYKQGLGNGRDINRVFAALARAAGFDARVAKIADRGIKFFALQDANGHFLPAESVAVKAGDGWRFYDAAGPFLPPGTLRWQEESSAALIGDPKELVFQMTPLTDAAASAVDRQARFTLDEQGTLEGKATFVYTGQQAIEQRSLYRGDTPSEREESFRDQLRRQFPAAEITEVTFEHFAAPDKPLAVTFQMKAPAYAQRTGKRFFVQPAVFQATLPTRFPRSERRHDIYFRYPWSEHDKIQITLPEGFDLDQPAAPGQLPLGDVGEYDGRLFKTSDGRSVILERSFRFGVGGRILFPKAAYGQVKKVFDLVHELDSHAVTLKSETGGL